MSYSLDEWFDVYVLPKIKNFVAQTEIKKENNNSEYQTNADMFLEMLNEIFCARYDSTKDHFISLLLTSILTSESDEQFYKILQNCFLKLDCDNNEKKLEKIVYTDCGIRVTCDFIQEKNEPTTN